jgi:rhodanese-related sulfurtransferase
MTAPGGARSIDQVLAAARARLRRVAPRAAAAAQAAGALLVDIRPGEVRAHDGEVPGALIVDRNVLEWRLDPVSPHRLPELTGYDQTVVVLCREGYASSLAACALQDLGLVNATDLDGGFSAWVAAGLPVVRRTTIASEGPVEPDDT